MQKTRRGLGKKEIDVILRKGLRVREGGALFVFRITKKSETRLGILIPKKIIKKATARNRIRRRWREKIREAGFTGVDLVVLVQGLKSGEQEKGLQLERVQQLINKIKQND